MRQKSVNFEFEARYFQLGEISPLTKNIIFVLHGYGQQAKYFIRKFSSIHNDQTCIIAPEGLSKFYLEGFGGRVGATWMTSEDRLTDIENYTNYLTAIYHSLLTEKPDITLSIIGFSQGAATASRWAASKGVEFDRLVLWAGIIPPDMDFERVTEKFTDKDIFYVYGTEDPFLTKERTDEMRMLSAKLKLSPITMSFAGNHDIHEETLKRIFSTND